MKYPISLKIKLVVYILLCIAAMIIFLASIGAGSNGYVLIALIRLVGCIILAIFAHLLRLHILDCIEDYRF